MIEVDNNISQKTHLPSGIPAKINRLFQLRDTHVDDVVRTKVIPLENWTMNLKYSYITSTSMGHNENILWSKKLLEQLQQKVKNGNGEQVQGIRSKSGATDATLLYDIIEAPFGTYFDIKEMQTGAHQSFPSCPFKVEISDDKENWQLLYEETEFLTNPKQHTMLGTARYVKLSVTKVHSSSGMKHLYFGMYDSNDNAITSFDVPWNILLVIAKENEKNIKIKPTKADNFVYANPGIDSVTISDGTTNPSEEYSTPIHSEHVSDVGEVFHINTQAETVGYEAWKAFSQKSSTYYKVYMSNAELGYKFKEPTIINKYSWTSLSTSSKAEHLRVWELHASNDSTNGTDGTWVELDKYQNGNLLFSTTRGFFNATPYLWYKLVLKASWGSAFVWLQDFRLIKADTISSIPAPITIFDILQGKNIIKPQTEFNPGTKNLYILGIIGASDTNIHFGDKEKTTYEEIWKAPHDSTFALKHLQTGYLETVKEDEKWTCPFKLFKSDNGKDWVEFYSSSEYLNEVKYHTFPYSRTKFIKIEVVSDGVKTKRAQIYFDKINNLVTDKLTEPEQILQFDFFPSRPLLEEKDFVKPSDLTKIPPIQIHDVQNYFHKGEQHGTNLMDSITVGNSGKPYEEVYDAGNGWKYKIESLNIGSYYDGSANAKSSELTISISEDNETWTEAKVLNSDSNYESFDLNIEGRFIKFSSVDPSKITFGKIFMDSTTSDAKSTYLGLFGRIIKYPYSETVIENNQKVIDESISILNNKLTQDTLVPPNQNGLCIGLDTRGHNIVVSKGSTLVAL